MSLTDLVLRRTWEIELRETGEHYAFVQGHVLSRLGTCGFQNSRETFKTNYMEPYSGISIPSMHPKPTARTVKEMRPTESPGIQLGSSQKDRPSGLASARCGWITRFHGDLEGDSIGRVDTKGARSNPPTQQVSPCAVDVSGAELWKSKRLQWCMKTGS